MYAIVYYFLLNEQPSGLFAFSRLLSFASPNTTQKEMHI